MADRLSTRTVGTALIIAIALAASVTSLRNGFVYDDVAAVARDSRIRSLDGLPHLLAVPYWSDEMRDRIYRPLTTASFALDWASGRGAPLAFHLTNVLLHLVVCALVLALGRRVLGGPGAFVAALWFAVHPVHVEVVAGVVGRSELLAAAGFLGAVLAYAAEGEAAASRPNGARRALLATVTLACAAVAYGGKEHALTLPAALLLADAWARYRRGARLREVFGAHAVTWAGTLALAFSYLAARHAVLGTTFGGGRVAAGLESLTAAGRAMVMAPAMLEWGRLLAVPLHLSADYSPNHFVPRVTLSLAHAAGAALVVGTVLAACALRRRAPGATFGVAWFALTASIAANIAFPTGVLLAERVLYLPSIGAALVVGALWQQVRGRLVWPVTLGVTVLLAVRTLARIPVWQDGERFYTALVHDAHGSYRSHWASGARAFEQHRPHDGEAELRHAIGIYPGDGALVQELGEHYLAAGLWAPADFFLTAAYRLDTLRVDAAAEAVLARLRRGSPDSAAALGVVALRRYPRAPLLLQATSDAYFALGEPIRALTYRRRIVYAFPNVWQYQYVAAQGAARAGRCDEARRRAERAIALAPSERSPRELRARIGEGTTCRAGA